VSPEELEWYLEDCLALKQEFPHLIAGFDLVGPENALKPLIDYIEPLLKFKKRQQELGVDIPFIFHAGETLGDGTMADVNLYDAILLGTKRIGHGYATIYQRSETRAAELTTMHRFSLAKHPELIKICREKGIAVEVCPIS
jgi:adenosine deaminase CECR1